MEILPKNLGTRPRLAVEVRPEGVVAARAEDAQALLAAVAERALPDGVLAPGLKAGNVVDGTRLAAALREALDAVAGRSSERTRYVTLVVPDSATRVLLLEFDEMPAKAAEALPIVRFRLKKLVPFDPDHAAVSYQVMSTERNSVQVLVVAMPNDVLAEYEGVVTAAGYMPGAVLPSTLAALACLDEQDAPVLAVNAGRGGVTTAIVRGGVLLLHRALELANERAEAHSLEALQAAGRAYDRIEAEALIETQVLKTEAHVSTREVAQSVSVAVAYFEDTLASVPDGMISAGTIGANGLQAILEENGITELKVREMVGADGLAAGTASRVPRGWLAGVRGALRN